jgi:uncharacterized membrane protein YdfJ with MMPL/SSD domain
MHGFLQRVGRTCAQWHWAVIIAWIVILAGLMGARSLWGGDFSNDYSVPGSETQAGLDVLQRAWWIPRWLDRILPHLDIEGGDIARDAVPTGPAGPAAVDGPTAPADTPAAPTR